VNVCGFIEGGKNQDGKRVGGKEIVDFMVKFELFEIF
jgi:hypothetical protein